VRNWVRNNAPISRAESGYLFYTDDLCSMDDDGDVVHWLENLIERFSPFGLVKVCTYQANYNPLSGHLIFVWVPLTVS
jgi:hypothetical protein